MLTSLATLAAIVGAASAVLAWTYHMIDAERGLPLWVDLGAGAVVALVCAAVGGWVSADLADVGARLGALVSAAASVVGGGLHQQVVGRLKRGVSEAKLPGQP